jgi:hypothetical protein
MLSRRQATSLPPTGKDVGAHVANGDADTDEWTNSA